MLLSLLILLSAGCLGDRAEDNACQDLCDVLVNDCDYSAYPSLTSCWEGCAFAAEDETYDVDGHLACVETIECDTFGILECSHEFEDTVE